MIFIFGTRLFGKMDEVPGINQSGMRAIEAAFEHQAHGFPVQTSEANESDGTTSPIPVAAVQAMYFVSGRNQEKNQDVCITIYAKNPDEARSKAAAAGILVSAVESGGMPAT